MNEHLPECPVEKRLRAGRTVGSQSCICDALRACEEKVKESMGRWWEKFSRDQFDAGYAAGLDAAREVVVSVGTGSGYVITRNLTLAAIDELREKP